MHFLSEGGDFQEIVPLLTLFFVVFAVLVALKIFRRAFGDETRYELKQLNHRYARGLLSFENYQREKARLHKLRVQTGRATAPSTGPPAEPPPGPEAGDSGVNPLPGA